MNDQPAFPMGNTEAAMYASCLEDLGNPNLDKAEQVHLSAKVNALCGMTLRDYFAAKALQGLLANGEYWNHIGGTDSAECAALAYIHADAMMKARNGN